MSTPEMADAFATAWEHHRAGRVALAEPLYRQVIEANPRQADALHLFGRSACSPAELPRPWS